MIDGVQILHDEEDLRIATWGRVLIIRFVGAPPVEGLRQIRNRQRALVREHGGKVAMFSVITPKTSINFDDEARKTSSQLLDEMKRDIAVGVQVVFKKGFFTSIVRSVLMGVNMVTKPPYPTKICSALPEAADFVAEHLGALGDPVTPDDLIAAVSTVLEAASGLEQSA